MKMIQIFFFFLSFLLFRYMVYVNCAPPTPNKISWLCHWLGGGVGCGYGSVSWVVGMVAWAWVWRRNLLVSNDGLFKLADDWDLCSSSASRRWLGFIIKAPLMSSCSGFWVKICLGCGEVGHGRGHAWWGGLWRGVQWWRSAWSHHGEIEWVVVEVSGFWFWVGSDGVWVWFLFWWVFILIFCYGFLFFGFGWLDFGFQLVGLWIPMGFRLNSN